MNMLNISCRGLSDRNAAKLLMQMDQVDEINASGNKIGASKGVSVENLLNLFRKNKRYSTASKSVQMLGSFENLYKLNLSSNNLQDIDVVALSHNKAIKRLDLNGNKDLTDEAVKALLQNNPNLYELSMRQTRVSDKGAIELAKRKNLVALDLKDCPLTDDGIMALAKNTSLSRLLVTASTAQSLLSLAENGTLSLIDFGEKITDKALIQKMLERLAHSHNFVLTDDNNASNFRIITWRNLTEAKNVAERLLSGKSVPYAQLAPRINAVAWLLRYLSQDKTKDKINDVMIDIANASNRNLTDLYWTAGIPEQCPFDYIQWQASSTQTPEDFWAQALPQKDENVITTIVNMGLKVMNKVLPPALWAQPERSEQLRAIMSGVQKNKQTLNTLAKYAAQLSPLQQQEPRKVASSSYTLQAEAHIKE